MNTIFTTRGDLPESQVELRISVIEETEERKVLRRDKYDMTDGAWVGNDLHVEIKKLPALFGEAGALG